MSRLAFLLLAAALGLRAAPLHPTLDHTVMVGYQGWFRAPGDGSGLGWAHYQSPDTHTFAPGHLSIEYWPDLTEAAPEEKFPTAFHHADGSVASVFSSETPATIDRHFRWMADYGIDGAFVQRFAAPIIGHDDASRARLASTDRVLAACRAAAEHRGRAFTIMYDLTGLPADSIEAVIADWKHVIDDLHVRASPAWQHHRDRPLVAVWGVGFSDDRAYTVADTARLLDFLQNDPVYGGSAVLLGIPAWWRRQTADATADPALLPLLARADVLSPWTPGRIYDLGGVAAWVTNFWIPDRDWCRARGIDYLPVVFPGFSWKNLTGRDQAIDRLDGRFLWEQYRQLAAAGFTSAYQAMFDEMDEGTQIFKVTADVPPGQNLLSYAPLPPDHYLWLVGEAARRLRARQPFPAALPSRPGHPGIDAYLKSGDAAARSGAADSTATQLALFDLGTCLATASPDAWLPVGDTRRLQAPGHWFGPHLGTTDPAAHVTWRLQPPADAASRSLVLEARFSGDPNHDHARAARLRIFHGDTLVAETRVDTTADTLRWRPLATLDSGAVPCAATLDDPDHSGVLTLFDARLAPASGSPAP